jgi:hypothetical protein
MNQEEYTYVQEGDPTIKHFCGLNLWAMIPEEICPQTKFSTNNLKIKLSDITFAMCNTSIPALITKILDIKRQIEAEKGVAYKPDCFMTLLLDKLSGYNNEMFCNKIIAPALPTAKGI